ncbi:unnamed protein product, partial [Symbiodinium sp. KB8]
MFAGPAARQHSIHCAGGGAGGKVAVPSCPCARDGERGDLDPKWWDQEKDEKTPEQPVLSPKSAKDQEDQEDKKTQEQPVLSPKSAKDQEDKKTQEQPVLSPNSVKDQEDKKTQEEPVSQSK